MQNLSVDILSIIFNKLGLADYIHLSVVCKKFWQTSKSKKVRSIENFKNTYIILKKIKKWKSSLFTKSGQLQKHIDFSKLAGTREISVANCDMTSVPQLDIPRFGVNDLRSLHLESNLITNIPVLNLPNLCSLNLSGNRLNILGNGLRNLGNLNCLTGLEYLYLNNNDITELPEFDLPNLVILELAHNKIVQVPYLNLPNLNELNLENNCLRSLKNIEYMRRLVNLNLKSNQIVEILELYLPELHTLNISNNPLQKIEILNLPSLSILLFENNDCDFNFLKQFSGLQVSIYF